MVTRTQRTVVTGEGSQQERQPSAEEHKHEHPAEREPGTVLIQCGTLHYCFHLFTASPQQNDTFTPFALGFHRAYPLRKSTLLHPTDVGLSHRTGFRWNISRCDSSRSFECSSMTWLGHLARTSSALRSPCHAEPLLLQPRSQNKKR